MSGQNNIACNLSKKKTKLMHQYHDSSVIWLLRGKILISAWVNISFQNREINRSSDQACQYRSTEQVGGILLWWNYSGHGKNSAHAANSWVRPWQKPTWLRKAWPESGRQHNAYQTEYGVLEAERAGDFGQREESCSPPSSPSLRILISLPPHPPNQDSRPPPLNQDQPFLITIDKSVDSFRLNDIWLFEYTVV